MECTAWPADQCVSGCLPCLMQRKQCMLQRTWALPASGRFRLLPICYCNGSPQACHHPACPRLACSTNILYALILGAGAFGLIGINKDGAYAAGGCCAGQHFAIAACGCAPV